MKAYIKEFTKGKRFIPLEEIGAIHPVLIPYIIEEYKIGNFGTTSGYTRGIAIYRSIKDCPDKDNIRYNYYSNHVWMEEFIEYSNILKGYDYIEKYLRK